MGAIIKDLDQPEFNMNNYKEFMPWQTWKTMPQNKDLTYDEALSKFEVERNESLKKMIYYENQAKINKSDQ
jgi:hypothetical protein